VASPMSRLPPATIALCKSRGLNFEPMCASSPVSKWQPAQLAGSVEIRLARLGSPNQRADCHGRSERGNAVNEAAISPICAVDSENWHSLARNAALYDRLNELSVLVMEHNGRAQETRPDSPPLAVAP